MTDAMHAALLRHSYATTPAGNTRMSLYSTAGRWDRPPAGLTVFLLVDPPHRPNETTRILGVYATADEAFEAAGRKIYDQRNGGHAAPAAGGTIKCCYLVEQYIGEQRVAWATITHTIEVRHANRIAPAEPPVPRMVFPSDDPGPF